jgi:hypothetical protein
VLSVVILGFIAYLLSPKTKGGGPDSDDADPVRTQEGDGDAQSSRGSIKGERTTTA